MREERETLRTLLLVNTVRGVVGAKPITMKQLQAAPTDAESVDMEAIARRFNQTLSANGND